MTEEDIERKYIYFRALEDCSDARELFVFLNKGVKN